jgi:hypothetical protein
MIPSLVCCGILGVVNIIGFPFGRPTWACVDIPAALRGADIATEGRLAGVMGTLPTPGVWAAYMDGGTLN